MARKESFQGGSLPPRLEYYKREDDQQVRKKAIEVMRGDLAYYTSHITLLTGSGEDLVSITVAATQKWNIGFRRGESRDPFTFAMTKKEMRDIILKDLGLPLVLQPVKADSEVSRFDNRSRTIDGIRSVLAQKRHNALKTGEPFYDGTIDPDNIKYKPDISRKISAAKSDKATIIAIQEGEKPLEVEQRYIRLGMLLGVKSSLETRHNKVDLQLFASSEDPEFVFEALRKKVKGVNSHLYVLYFSDGQAKRFNADATLKNACALAEVSEVFGYGYIPSQNSSYSQLSEILRRADNDKVISMTMRDKKHVKPALQKYFNSYL